MKKTAMVLILSLGVIAAIAYRQQVTWQYLVTDITWTGTEFAPYFAEQLNSYGQQGWELVAIIQPSAIRDGYGYTYGATIVMKRQK